MIRVNKMNIAQDVFVECATRYALDEGTQQDVADELGLSLANVSSRISRYRKRPDPICIPAFKQAARGTKINSEAANAQIKAMIAEREKSAI